MDNSATERVPGDLPDRQPLQVQQPRRGRVDTLENNLHLRTLNQARDLDL